MHESLFAYKKQRYLRIAVVAVLLAATAYSLNDPYEPPNGGTWLGYTLGTVGALLIVWLMLFGIRKRSYFSTSGSVQGWLSAHVYLGTSLLVIVSLHAGMQFGWNVHTLAYVLMIMVVVSGLFGIYVYAKYPEKLSHNRSGQTREQLLREVAEMDRRCQRLAAGLSADISELISSGANRTIVGGNTFAQLSGRDRSGIIVPSGDSQSGHKLSRNTNQKTAIDWLADHVSRTTEPQTAEKIRELITLLGNKSTALRQLRADIRIQGLLEAWLYVHVPLSFALLAALTVHIITVFIYW